MAVAIDLVRIRDARLDELERLADIEREAGAIFEETEIAGLLNGETIPADELAQMIGEGAVWVAATTENDSAVGFVVLTKLGSNAHIDEIDVLPAFGKLGIGTALLEHACGRAAELGFPAVTLSTFRDIPWNAPFYQKHGFEIVAESDHTDEMKLLREIESAKGLPIEKRIIMMQIFHLD